MTSSTDSRVAVRRGVAAFYDAMAAGHNRVYAVQHAAEAAVAAERHRILSEAETCDCLHDYHLRKIVNGGGHHE